MPRRTKPHTISFGQNRRRFLFFEAKTKSSIQYIRKDGKDMKTKILRSKLLVSLLALAMVFSLIPSVGITAFADDDGQTFKVYLGGEDYYYSLKDSEQVSGTNGGEFDVPSGMTLKDVIDFHGWFDGLTFESCQKQHLEKFEWIDVDQPYNSIEDVLNLQITQDTKFVVTCSGESTEKDDDVGEDDYEQPYNFTIWSSDGEFEFTEKDGNESSGEIYQTMLDFSEGQTYKIGDILDYVGTPVYWDCESPLVNGVSREFAGWEKNIKVYDDPDDPESGWWYESAENPTLYKTWDELKEVEISEEEQFMAVWAGDDADYYNDIYFGAYGEDASVAVHHPWGTSYVDADWYSVRKDGTTVGSQWNYDYIENVTATKQGAELEGWVEYVLDGNKYVYNEKLDNNVSSVWTFEQIMEQTVPMKNVRYITKWSDVEWDEYEAYIMYDDTAAEELAAAKTSAKSELAAYKSASLYRPAQQTALANAIAAGNTAIDAAANEAAVTTALNAAKAKIDAIKTDAQLTAEELTAAKASAKSELAAYKSANLYRTAEQTALANAITAGNTAIDAAADKSAVATALATAKSNIDKLKTNAQYALEEAKAATEVVIKPVATPSASGTTNNVVEVEKSVIKEVVEAKKPLVVETTTKTSSGGATETVKAVFDTKALETITAAAKAEDSTVELVVEMVPETVIDQKLSTQQKTSLEKLEFAVVISASVLVDGKAVGKSEDGGFDGGKVTIAVPFTPEVGTKLSDYTVVFINDDGKIEKVPTAVVDGKLQVELGHFSEYAIVKTATFDAVVASNPELEVGYDASADNTTTTPKTGDETNAVPFAATMIAAATAFVVLNRKRRMVK